MLESKPVDTSVYYMPNNRICATAIISNRKRLGRPRSEEASAVWKARVQRSSTGEGPSSAVPEVKNKSVVMDTVLDDVDGPVVDIDTAILESALKSYCRISQCPCQELPDHLEQCGCDV